MKAVLGLGNPSPQYRFNRHNIGYRIVDALAKSQGVKFRSSLLLKAALVQTRIGRTEVMLIKPGTFMNNSGQCIRRVLGRYKIGSTDLLVVYDDADLKFGRLRLRPQGTSAGHRGMDSVLAAFGTEEISRLRVGIGESDRRVELSDYVLSDFSPEEEAVLKEVIDTAVSACREWVNRGIALAMEKYNSKSRDEGG